MKGRRFLLSKALLTLVSLALIPACGGSGGGGFDYGTVVFQGEEYGAGQLAVQADPASYAFTGASNYYGTFTFTTASDVTVYQVDGGGAASSNPETHIYSAPELVVTQGGVSGVDGRGPVRRRGDLFLQVQDSNTNEPFLTVGARRFATSGFTTASIDGDWSFALFELDVNPGPVIGSHAAKIGTLSLSGGSGSATVTRDETGAPGGAPTALTYTVDVDGLVHLDAGAFHGYIGGSPSAELFTLSSDTDANQIRFFVVARNHDLQVGSSLSGEYRLVIFYLRSIGGAFEHAGRALGTVTFTAGGTYSGTIDLAETNGMTMQEPLSGTYTVDAAADEIVLADAGLGAIYLRAGPDLNTVFGISPEGGGEFSVLMILSK